MTSGSECSSASVRKFRLMHRREDGKHCPLILQNRIVEGASAEELLRAAISFLGNAAPQISALKDTAWAVQAFSKFIDYWEIESE